MNWDMPAAVTAHPDADRALAAVQACTAAGAALLTMRGARAHAVEVGTQLKTAPDRAAEGWVLGWLETHYPEDAYLAEERHAASDGTWHPPARYWTVDALDGTRSFMDGFAGFCVQAAFVDETGPRLGVIYEPVAETAYLGVRGAGAYRRRSSGPWQRLHLPRLATWPRQPRFVDSTQPRGAVGALYEQRGGRFVECGSIGLKICRVACGEADVYVKELTFRLWDVAPGEILLRESGGELGTWDGESVDYARGPVERHNLMAAPAELFRHVAAALGVHRR